MVLATRENCKVLIISSITWSWWIYLELEENIHGIDLMVKQRAGLIDF